MKTNQLIRVPVMALMLAGCTTSLLQVERTVIDNSSQGEKLPAWVKDTKVSWEEKDTVFFRSAHAVRGDQRVSGCYDLAKFDIKENLLTEINQEIRGELNLASEGISEGTDPMITKALQSTIEGKIRGLRINEEAYERYLVNQTERIDCFVLAQMSKGDYQKLKSSVLNKMSEVSPDVQNALRKRQAVFFGGPEAAITIPEASKKALEKFFKMDDGSSQVKIEELTSHESVSATAATGTLEAIRNNVAQIARAFQGVKYQFGSNLSQDGMIDCSALTKKVYEVVGVNLPRTSPEQFEYVKSDAITGTPTTGDLVFFDGFRGKGQVSHVGIMVSGSEFINANGNEGEVKLDDLSAPYWQEKYLGARRLVNQTNFPNAGAKLVGTL